MDFSTLFPTGVAMVKQPHIHQVGMHEYALHLIHYHDYRFWKHPHFCYYIYKLIMRHCSHFTASVFVKHNFEYTLTPTIFEIFNQLQDLHNDKIIERVVRFGSTLRGTHSYWNKRRVELTNMITQQGTPILFFTLSVADTKWKDLHALMPTQDPSTSNQHQQWKIQNIIANPHIASQYMHNRFKIFLEEVLQKGLHITDSWCRSVTCSYFLSFSSCSPLKNFPF